jgi:cytochrome c-type biogenesis protein CcmF
MLGSIAISIAFASSLAAIILYALVERGRREYTGAARLVTHLAILSVMLTAGTLLYYIFNYRFDIAYVYKNVSTTLSKPLLFATFYANQEGSFMLWALLTSIVAIFLLPYAARQRYEAPVMAVYMSVMAFLCLMLIIKSPFETIYSAFPGEAPAGFIPENGRGLNPSLENLWIVIHPPMLFLGFTMLAVPFAFAIAGLIRRDFQGWVTTSMPWTLAAGMLLGFGIMLGGFWAYETLGWGGYWAWDPVENSSLMPWLVTIAATHTMLSQKRTGGLIKTNIAMTLLAYVFVLYSSFLTRSGVLGDASVHSFTDPGATVFRVLLTGLVFFIVGSFAIFFFRWKAMNVARREFNVLSRENMLSIGAAVIMASTLIVFLGTSAPLISTKVPIEFYNKFHIPIAIALLLVNALSLHIKWKQTSTNELIRKSTIALGLATASTIAVALIGSISEPLILALIFSAFFALFVNLEIAFAIRKTKFMGAYISHVGIALFVLGVVASAYYERKEIVQLPENQAVKVLDGKYELSYAGVEMPKADHYNWLISVKGKDGLVAQAKPLSYFTPWNNKEQPIINPDILRFATKDVYFTFMGLDRTGGVPTDTLGKGQSISRFGDSLLITFIDYDFSQEEKTKMMSGKEFTVKAVVQVRDTVSRESRQLTLSVTRDLETAEATMEDVIVPGTPYHIQLAELKPDMQNPANSKVVLRYFDEKNPPANATQFVTIEIFEKPLINLVWAGIIILVLGFGFSVVRRRKEALLAIERAEKKYEKLVEQRSRFAPDASAVGGMHMHSSEKTRKEA